MYSKIAYSAGFSQGLRPDPAMLVSEWADTFRILPEEAASEPGPWRTSRTPYLKAIMDALSPEDPCDTVVFMKGSQIGGSEVGNNWLCSVFHLSPAPVLLVLPTLSVARDYSKRRVAKMIEATPEVRERFIGNGKGRNGKETILMKEFRGGFLSIVGANSASSLRSMPIRFLMMDEVDSYPGDVDSEGDVPDLARKRTDTFYNRKIFMVSSPKLKDHSRIETEYQKTSQKKYFVPCPDCGNMDTINWKRLVWDEGLPETVRLRCDCCGSLTPESAKSVMLENGEWRDTSAVRNPKVKGFHLSGLYSPLGWLSWEACVRQFLEVKDNPEQFKTFVNTVWGETWAEEYSARAGADELKTRAGGYRAATVPMAGLMLVGSVDVQDNRLEWLVRAFGRGERSWLVDRGVINGDPHAADTWERLDEILQNEYLHESGAYLSILAAGIDSGGHATAEVYEFCRTREKRHIIALKGASDRFGTTPIIGKSSKVDIVRGNFTLEKAVKLYTVGTIVAKTTIMGRLRQVDQSQPGAYHWYEGLENDYFEQLTAEKKVHRSVGGRNVVLFEKVKGGARNEALDLEVYALAVLRYFYTKTNHDKIWTTLEARLAEAIAAQAESTDAADQKERINKPRIRRGSFSRGRTR